MRRAQDMPGQRGLKQIANQMSASLLQAPVRMLLNLRNLTRRRHDAQARQIYDLSKQEADQRLASEQALQTQEIFASPDRAWASSQQRDRRRSQDDNRGVTMRPPAPEREPGPHDSERVVPPPPVPPEMEQPSPGFDPEKPRRQPKDVPGDDAPL